MNGDLRRTVIDAGVRIVEGHGAGALTARKVTAAVDTSTSAIYRLFGGMPGLLDAVADETFLRFAHHLPGVHRREMDMATTAAQTPMYTATWHPLNGPVVVLVRGTTGDAYWACVRHHQAKYT